jgi:hypothetical protein
MTTFLGSSLVGGICRCRDAGFGESSYLDACIPSTLVTPPHDATSWLNPPRIAVVHSAAYEACDLTRRIRRRIVEGSLSL